jgi:choline dehydrogenase
MAGTDQFDVVVVGGGAAGCVVAARLAESPSNSVLLLEAGPDLRANMPEEFRGGWRLTQGFDWGLRPSRTRVGLSTTSGEASSSAEPRG